MTPASQRALAEVARQNAASITTVRQTGPLGAIVLGVLLILAGTVPFRRPRNSGWRGARLAKVIRFRP